MPRVPALSDERDSTTQLATLSFKAQVLTPPPPNFDIKIENYVWRVHIDVFAAKSDFFKALQESQFKEGQERCVTLFEDRAALIARFILWMYCGSYEVFRGDQVQSLTVDDILISGFRQPLQNASPITPSRPPPSFGDSQLEDTSLARNRRLPKKFRFLSGAANERTFSDLEDISRTYSTTTPATTLLRYAPNMADDSMRQIIGGKKLDITDFTAAIARRDPDAPKPEDEPEDYTLDILKGRKAYAETLQKRKVTPRSCAFAAYYERHVEQAIEATEDGEADPIDRQVLYEKLHALEVAMQDAPELTVIPSAETKALYQGLQKLKRYEFYTRYSDYCAELLTHLKKHATDQEMDEEARALKHLWTRIDSKIVAERQAVERDPEGDGVGLHKRQPTIAAIESICRSAGMDSETTFDAIHLYAERNAAFHANVTEMLQQAKYSELAEQLYKDENELDKMEVPIAPEHDINIIRDVINQLKDLYFEIAPGDENLPSAWRWTEAATEVRLKAERHAEIKKGMEKQRKMKTREFVRRAKVLQDAHKGFRVNKRTYKEAFTEEEQAIIAREDQKTEKLIGIGTEIERRERVIKKRRAEVDEELSPEFAALHNNLYPKRDSITDTIRGMRMTDSTEDEQPLSLKEPDKIKPHDQDNA